MQQYTAESIRTVTPHTPASGHFTQSEEMKPCGMSAWTQKGSKPLVFLRPYFYCQRKSGHGLPSMTSAWIQNNEVPFSYTEALRPARKCEQFKYKPHAVVNNSGLALQCASKSTCAQDKPLIPLSEGRLLTADVRTTVCRSYALRKRLTQRTMKCFNNPPLK